MTKIEQNEPKSVAVYEVSIVLFPATKVAVLEHHGDHALLPQSVAQFIEWRKSSGLSPVKTSNTYGIAYTDPNTTPAADFRFDIAGEVTQDVPENAYGIITKTLPEGRYAVVRHVGSHDTMDPAIYYVHQQWLRQNGETRRELPCFFHYQNFYPDVPEHEQITDIYVPLV